MKIKHVQIYHLLSGLICFISFLCGLFIFRDAFSLLIESAKDLVTSISYYFREMFGLENNVYPTVIDRNIGLISLPITSSDFVLSISYYFVAFFDLSNFLGYLNKFAKILFFVLQILVIAGPILLICIKLISSYYSRVENNDYGKDSYPLIFWKKLSEIIYNPTKQFVKQFIEFLTNHKYYLYLCLIIWLFNFNIISIVIDFIAFYLYFAVSFDVEALYVQFVNILLALQPLFKYIPWPGFLFLALYLIDRFRKRVAFNRLEHMENRNKGFINALPISVMVVGTMGKRKTTMLTDMALSLEVILRDEAYKRLLEIDIKFPYFPWPVFERALKIEIECHRIYNLSTCRFFVRKLKKMFFLLQNESCRDEWQRYCSLFVSRWKDFDFIFGYDYNRYGFVYDDGLKVINIFDALEDYAQLYFIYILRTSLLISNYSIRTDLQQLDMGNFPMWDKDFFKKRSSDIDKISEYAHILDFDILRLGRKIIERNINANSFDFGVICITEIAKERGNQYDTNELKKSSDNTNQKNDLFNHFLKMIRHPGTVAYYPFVRVLTDDQREDSLAADVRQLCDIIHIAEASENRLALPLFFIGEMLYDFVFSKFISFYQDFRFRRADNTLLMHLIKSISSKVINYYSKIYNLYGYSVLDIKLERSKDGPMASKKYYLCSKKIYSKRFATDCFSDYFADRAKSTAVGLVDYPQYKSERATAEELRKQNSYFVLDLYKLSNNDKKNTWR